MRMIRIASRREVRCKEAMAGETVGKDAVEVREE
jgi:hypothetical protein